MDREADRVVRNARFVDVSMLAWAFSTTGYGPPGFWAEIAYATRAACDILPPRSLAGISYSCAKAGQVDAKLFAAVAQRALDTADEFGAHDAAAICWAFSAAGVPAVKLYEVLASKLVAGSQVVRLSPPLAAELAWGFAAAQVHSPRLFELLEEVCISHIAELETEDAAGFAWAFATMRQPGPAVYTAIAAYAERFVGRFRPPELRMLSWALAEAGVACEALAAVRCRH